MLHNPLFETYCIAKMGTLIKEKLYSKYLPWLAMSGFAPLSCLMKSVKVIFQRVLKRVGEHFVSTLLMCASCFCKYSLSRNLNFQQINAITKQLSLHFHCSIRCMGCGSMLMKSAVLCVNLLHARKGLRRFSQSYAYFYESS